MYIEKHTQKYLKEMSKDKIFMIILFLFKNILFIYF